MRIPLEPTALLALQDQRTKVLVTWGLRIVVGLVFFVPAVIALSGQTMVVREFDAVPFGQGLRIATACLQIAAALLVLVPAASLLSAVVLLVIDAGALIFQLFFLHGDFVHVILLALPLLALLFIESGCFDEKLAELDE
ncbi:hypothetical protein [Labrys monachus]|uniref:Chromate transport protein ChrA n=1 Tax=Labrys monachus TaxID=217067 RepID=A0ABU0FG63_9HYPH|nr:hypothetical protein [Labrys monachus]MDQ0393119.1 chromate transport protein ChrA [Labrys monachus]